MAMQITEAIRRSQIEYPVNLFGLCSDLGIRLNETFLPDDISGELVPAEDNGFQINVNAHHNHRRQRFTIAHEIGHFVYHRGLIGNGIADDRAYRSTDAGKYHNSLIGLREETLANRFAANLLMPEHLISIAEAAGHTTPKELADALLVSVPAMRIRLGLPRDAATANQGFS
jgi:Zn-dependent peptidase ImmA (M78 family)